MEFDIQALIKQYGLVTLFVGTLIEGEIFVLAAGFMASKGYFPLTHVIMVSIIGAMIGDQICFYLGYHGLGRWGRSRLQKMPKVRWIQMKVRRWRAVSILLALFSRFIYGFKMAIPITLGYLRMRPMEFLAYNIIGATFWSILFAKAGFYGKQWVDILISELHDPDSEWWLALLLVLVLILITIIVRRRTQKWQA
jgi:membrane protein DedA with SNARE-associated domain